MSAPPPPATGRLACPPGEDPGVGRCGGGAEEAGTRGQGEARTEPPASRAVPLASRAVPQAVGTHGVPRSSGGPLSVGSLFTGDPMSSPVQSGPRVACTVCFSTVWKLKFTSTCFWASKGASGAPGPLLQSFS